MRPGDCAARGIDITGKRKLAATYTDVASGYAAALFAAGARRYASLCGARASRGSTHTGFYAGSAVLVAGITVVDLTQGVWRRIVSRIADVVAAPGTDHRATYTPTPEPRHR